MNIYSPGESEDASDPITITSLNSDASLLINIFCLRYETLPGPISILRHWFVGTTVSPLVLHACFAKRVLESVYIHNSRSPWVLNIKSIVSLCVTNLGGKISLDSTGRLSSPPRSSDPQA